MSLSKHIKKDISSSIDISANAELIWENITNVRLEQFKHPRFFRILGIPRPVRAELILADTGGQRVAYFENGKRFIQKITTWKPYGEYSFDFNPEKGFIVGHFFDLSDGVFRVPGGSYHLTNKGAETALELSTTYSLAKRIYFIFNLPVRFILKAFQRYLLRSIKKNSET